MPAPLEQLLTRKCKIPYSEAKLVVAQGRVALGMEPRGAWTQELFDFCVNQVEGTKDNGDNSVDATASTSSSSVESEESIKRTEKKKATTTTTSTTSKSVKQNKAASKSRMRRKSVEMTGGNFNNNSNNQSKNLAKAPVNKSNFQQPSRALAPFRSCSSTLAAFRNCSSDHLVAGIKPQVTSEDLVPLPRNSLRRESQAPLIPGSLRGRMLLDSLHQRPRKSSALYNGNDDDSTESDSSSCDSLLEFAADEHSAHVPCV